MEKKEKAEQLFDSHFNCSQSVLSAYADELNISMDQCLKISCAFGAGMGRQQLICGAVAGALMVIGLKYGKGINDPEEYKKLTYKKTEDFIDKFKRVNKTIYCKELLDNLNMSNPEEYKKIIEQNMFKLRCRKYVGDAIDILSDIL